MATKFFTRLLHSRGGISVSTPLSLGGLWGCLTSAAEGTLCQFHPLRRWAASALVFLGLLKLWAACSKSEETCGEHSGKGRGWAPPSAYPAKHQACEGGFLGPSCLVQPQAKYHQVTPVNTTWRRITPSSSAQDTEQKFIRQNKMAVSYWLSWG